MNVEQEFLGNESLIQISVENEPFRLIIKQEALSTDESKRTIQTVCDESYGTLEELIAAYKDRVGFYVDDKREDEREGIEYMDMWEGGNVPARLLNLKKVFKKSLQENKNDISTLSGLEEEFIDRARKIVNDWFKKKKNKSLENIVFYWDESSCDIAYINNKNADESYIDKCSGEWLDGDTIEKTFFSFSGGLPELLRVIRNKNNNDILTIDYFMYHLCARLEASPGFDSAVIVQPSFRAFNVWHDDESVNFKLRKNADKCRKKPVEDFMGSIQK